MGGKLKRLIDLEDGGGPSAVSGRRGRKGREQEVKGEQRRWGGSQRGLTEGRAEVMVADELVHPVDRSVEAGGRTVRSHAAE